MTRPCPSPYFSPPKGFMPKWLNRTALRFPYLTLCTTEVDYLKAARHLRVKDPLGWLGDHSAASTHTWTNCKTGNVCCVVTIKIDRKRPMSVTASVLGHEAVHVAQEMFDHINEVSPGKEIQAYAVQNILCELLEEYERQSKPRKKPVVHLGDPS